MFYTIEHELTQKTTLDHIYFDGLFFCSTKQGNGQKICDLFNNRGVKSLDTFRSNLTHEEKLRFLFATHSIFSECFSRCATQRYCVLQARPA